MNNDKLKIADYFMQQCMGGSDGHMAVIPHNPNIKAFIQAFCNYAPDRGQFAEFIIEMGNVLKEEHEKAGF